MKKWVILIVAVFAGAVLWKEFGRNGVTVGGGATFVNELPTTSPLYAQQQEFIDRMNADPALVERYAGSRGVFAEMNFALNRGAQSLDGPSLLKATKAMSALIPRLPPASCAKLIRGNGEIDPQLALDIDAAMARLPKSHHRNLWDFYVRALQAEVQNAPIRPRNAQNEQYAMQHLASKFNGVFAERLMRVMANPLAASDEDACWAVNSLTFTATQLDPQSAEALSRIIWSGKDG
jgi:hypothetical protein